MRLACVQLPLVASYSHMWYLVRGRGRVRVRLGLRVRAIAVGLGLGLGLVLGAAPGGLRNEVGDGTGQLVALEVVAG